MGTRTFVLFSAAAAALITLAACSSSSPSASGSTSGSNKITIGSDQANDHGTQDATGKTTFAIESHNDSSGYYFNPTILQGSAGQSITLEIKNDGSVQHNFSITSKRRQLLGGQLRMESVDQLGDLRAHDREEVSAAPRCERVWRAARHDEEPAWSDALP